MSTRIKIIKNQRPKNKLQQLREANGLERSELAEIIGVSTPTIADYETGHIDLKNAKVIIVYKLSKSLNCTIEDLLEL